MSALFFTLAAMHIILSGVGASQIVSGDSDKGAAIFATVFLSLTAALLIFAGVRL